MPLANDLLAQARYLASREPKKPRQASLRRAVSAAYYALFHLLAGAGSSVMAPAQPMALRKRVRRAFAHAEMKRVCQYFRQGNIAGIPPAIRVLLQDPLEPQLIIVAGAFVELQEARHSADYDIDDVFTRLDVLEKVELVDQAFSAWRAVRDHPNAKVFLAALLLERLWRAG